MRCDCERALHTVSERATAQRNSQPSRTQEFDSDSAPGEEYPAAVNSSKFWLGGQTLSRAEEERKRPPRALPSGSATKAKSADGQPRNECVQPDLSINQLRTPRKSECQLAKKTTPNDFGGRLCPRSESFRTAPTKHCSKLPLATRFKPRVKSRLMS